MKVFKIKEWELVVDRNVFYLIKIAGLFKIVGYNCNFDKEMINNIIRLIETVILVKSLKISIYWEEDLKSGMSL